MLVVSGEHYNVINMNQTNTKEYKTLSCPRLAMGSNGIKPCTNCQSQSVGCHLEGNPNVPYWAELGFKFEKSFDITKVATLNTIEKENWNTINDDIILMSSFMRFPSSEHVNEVHRYLHFTDEINNYAEKGLHYFLNNLKTFSHRKNW